MPSSPKLTGLWSNAYDRRSPVVVSTLHVILGTILAACLAAEMMSDSEGLLSSHNGMVRIPPFRTHSLFSIYPRSL